MELSPEELGRLLQPRQLQSSHSFTIGQQYLIRCVTHYYVGRLDAVTDTDLVLTNACWVADTGRFYNALKGEAMNELEPFIDQVIISRGSIVDATPYRHKLPRDQK
jgi:hypothetical protein